MCFVLVIGIRCQCLDNRQVLLPPVGQVGHELRMALGHTGVVVDVRSNVALVGQSCSEVGIPDAMACGVFFLTTRYEQAVAQTRVVVPEVAQGINFADRYAAVQMGAHVVRFGRRRIVHIAADVAVVVFRFNVRHRHTLGIAVDVMPGAVGVYDFVDVFRPQVVLRLAFAVFAVGIDEQYLIALQGTVFVQNQNAGRNAGAVEQVAGQANDGFEITSVNEILARLALFSTPEQHAVRHDGGHAAMALEHGQHVLHEHQVSLFALFRHPDVKPARVGNGFFFLGAAAVVLGFGLGVVLTEGRIGEHAVESAQLVVLVFVLRVGQGVSVADVGVRDTVQQHVHLADGPGGAHLFLTGQHQVFRVAAAFAQVIARLDQHAARPYRGVVHAHVFFGVADFDADAHDFGWGVKLASLLACRIGKVLDQPFIGGTEQVRKLKVFISQRDLFEVLDEINQSVVIQRVLADLVVEVDGALEHILQGIGVFFFQRLQRLVECGADIFLDVLERRLCVAGVIDPRLVPAGARWHVEVFA